MIDTQAIRNKILDLALRGKLTEQLPEDGTAEELLQQIQAEKETPNKPAKAKKEKPLQENEDTIVLQEIPDNWKWVQFSELFSLTNGTASRGAAGGSAYPVLRLADLKNGEIDTRSIREVLLSESEYKSHILKKGDMIFIRVNGSREKVAMPFCYHGEETISYCDHLFCAHCVSSLIFVPYIRLAFKIPSTREQIEPKIKTTAGQNTINQEGLGSILIPLPPTSEQHRIVKKVQQAFSILDTIDALQTQYHDNLSTLKSKLIDAGIQGKLTEQLPEDGTAEELYQQIQQEKQALEKAGKIKKYKPLPPVSDEEKPFDIPDNWKWVQLAQICQIINGDRGKNYPAKSTLQKHGIPFISAQNLDGKSVINDERLFCLTNEQYQRLGSGKLRENDIVICIRGSLGKHGRYPYQMGAIASSLVICRIYGQYSVLSDFIMMWLDSSFFVKEIEKYDGGSAQPNLAANSLEKFLLPLPPLAEQKRIVAKLEELLPLCEV